MFSYKAALKNHFVALWRVGAPKCCTFPICIYAAAAAMVVGGAGWRAEETHITGLAVLPQYSDCSCCDRSPQ